MTILRPRRNPPLPLLIAMLGLLSAATGGCPHRGTGLDSRLGPPRGARATSPRTGPPSAELRRAVEAICDRWEDCAVERNVALARSYGGTAADVDAARTQARRALHSRYVRRWCKQRLTILGAKKILGIRQCLSQTACEPFFQCAAIPDQPARVR